MLEVQSIGTQFLGQAVEVFNRKLPLSQFHQNTIGYKYAGSIRPVKTQDHQERRLIYINKIPRLSVCVLLREKLFNRWVQDREILHAGTC